MHEKRAELRHHKSNDTLGESAAPAKMQLNRFPRKNGKANGKEQQNGGTIP